MVNRSIRLFRSAICPASALLLSGIAALASATMTASDASAATRIADRSADGLPPDVGEQLYLEVTLNGNGTREIVPFVRSGDAFRADTDALRMLGLRLPLDKQGVIDVAALPDVAVHYDVPAQRLEITAPPDRVDQSLAVLNQRANPIPQPTASPGLLLNYDLYGTRDSRSNSSFSAHTELRAFNGWGVLSNTALSRWTDSSNLGASNDTVRLDTSVSRSFVDRTLTLRVGDFTSGGLDWTRSTRLGGIQLQRNFALQPELVTFPVPAFYGQASLPSTVDLYVDGMKQYSSDVPAGPFQLNTVPVVQGSGQAAVVVTDGLGRQTTVAFPFYTTDQLLRAGLSDFSLEAGAVRKGYGVDSFSYADDPAASGTYRFGLTNRLTLAGHAEAVPGLTEGGASAVMTIGQAGAINASFAASRDHGTSGQQAGVGYNWRNDRFNFSLDTLRTYGDYRDIASRYSLAPPERSDRALAGLTLGKAGSLGVSYVALKYPGQPRSRYASTYYSKSMGRRASFNLSANQDLDDHRERSVFLGISLALGNNASASLSGRHDRSGNLATLDVNKPINPDGGFGWRLRAQDGSKKQSRGGLAEAGYRGQNAELRAGMQDLNGDTLGYADLGGALVFMNRQLFAARRINDAFAVVSTDGVSDVPVLLENRPIGATNARGNLLVTPLNAYQRNKLSIDPMELPENVDISRVEAKAVPSDRAGTLVKFGIRTVQAASVILHDSAGQPLAVGSSVSLRGSSAPAAMVGYDGMVYLEGLENDNVLDIQTADSRCVAQFDYRQQDSSVPLIGPLICHEEQP